MNNKDKIKCINSINNYVKSILPASKYQQLNKDMIESEKRNFSDSEYYTDTDVYIQSHSDKVIKIEKRGDAAVQVITHILYRWIQSKIIYFFDEDIETHLLLENIEDILDIPVEILNHCPVPSFFIPIMNPYPESHKLCGFFVTLDRKHSKKNETFSNAGLQVIRFSITKDDKVRAVPVVYVGIEPTEGVPSTFRSLIESNLHKMQTLDYDALNKTYEQSKALIDDTYYMTLTCLLPYLMYLCSQNAEIKQIPETVKHYKPFNKSPMHSYSEVKQCICGSETGTRIRNFKRMYESRKGQGKGSMKAPHIRRAHYHRYWKGTGDNRHIEVRWMLPTYIHADMKDYMYITGAKVKRTY